MIIFNTFNISVNSEVTKTADHILEISKQGAFNVTNCWMAMLCLQDLSDSISFLFTPGPTIYQKPSLNWTGLNFTSKFFKRTNYFQRINDSQVEILLECNFKHYMQRFKNFLKKSRAHWDITAVKPTHKITWTLAQISVDR